MAVSKRLRFEILRRDNHACRYCGATAPDVKLTVDHVIPVALGGTDNPANLVTACASCNGGKTSSAPDSNIVGGAADDQLRWSLAMKQAAAELSADHLARLAFRATFETAWKSWSYEFEGKQCTEELPSDWHQSVEAIRVAGLPEEYLPEAVQAAMTGRYVKKPFNYFAGVTWNRITEMQQAARLKVEETKPSPADGSKARETAIALALGTWLEEWKNAASGAEPTVNDSKTALLHIRAADLAGYASQVVVEAAGFAGKGLSPDVAKCLYTAAEAIELVRESDATRQDQGGK